MRVLTTTAILIALLTTASAASPAPNRAHQPWPANPTWQEIVARAHPGELDVLRSIAECEQPGPGTSPARAKHKPRRRWRTAWGINAGQKYIGAYGMFRGTFALGQGPTKYPAPPSATPAEETGVALVVLRRFGRHAWGCG